MNRKNNAYHLLERSATAVIMVGLTFFMTFLIASGYGILWLKIICAIFSILIPLLSLLYLYIVKEWRKRRSQWLVAAFAALLICTLSSLILQFPSPTP